MNILNRIVEEKRRKNEEKRVKNEEGRVKKGAKFSLKEFLVREDRNGIIAEFKRRSPSKGIVNNKAVITEVASAYFDSGASGISVLTEEDFFGGSLSDLAAVRNLEIPLLRKDFIIDEYQVVESADNGADVNLLIAACLSADEIRKFTSIAHDLGMEVLLEIHSREEIDKYHPSVDLIGVNNRDLNSFQVNVQASFDLAEHLPEDAVWVSESGISAVETIESLKQLGYSGFLMGEQFMKQEDPGGAFSEFSALLNESLCR